jgi:hypothetical protein
MNYLGKILGVRAQKTVAWTNNGAELKIGSHRAARIGAAEAEIAIPALLLSFSQADLF